MYGGHSSLCVCLSLATSPQYCTDLDVSWGNDSGCFLLVHDWADLQSVHGFRCYDNIVPNVKCQQVLVLTHRVINFIRFTQNLEVVVKFCYLGDMLSVDGDADAAVEARI